jgi:hypothetical protein
MMTEVPLTTLRHLHAAQTAVFVAHVGKSTQELFVMLLECP